MTQNRERLLQIEEWIRTQIHRCKEQEGARRNGAGRFIRKLIRIAKQTLFPNHGPNSGLKGWLCPPCNIAVSKATRTGRSKAVPPRYLLCPQEKRSLYPESKYWHILIWLPQPILPITGSHEQNKIHKKALKYKNKQISN